MSRTYRSFAKINLVLEVLGRRPDGYHELRTLFQSVSLHDVIEVAAAEEGVGLEIFGADLPAGPENLAHRAATEFLNRWGSGGVELRLTKRIPVGGGLGGGSSNAATVLLALRDLYRAPETVEEMGEVAAALGADVPFFLVGGTALGTGRGDCVDPVPDLEEQEVWLVSPGVKVSTREVFASLSGAEHLKRRGRRRKSTLRPIGRPVDAVAGNDLEETVLGLFPEIKQVYTALVQSGAERVGVSGSGSSLFAFYPSPPDRRTLTSRLPKQSLVFRSRTLSRHSIAAGRVVEVAGEK